MNSAAAPILAVIAGVTIGHGSVAAVKAIDAHLAHGACMAEQNAAGFNKDHALKWCADRLK